MKKLITGFMISVLCIAGVFAGTFQESEYFTAARELAERGIIKQNVDHQDYFVNSSVLRQEIAVISRRVSGVAENSKCQNIFGDVSSTLPNNWVCKNVEALVENNFISGNDNFRPEDNISKAEALIMLIRSIGFDFVLDRDSSVSWQKQIVDYSVAKGVVQDFSDYGLEATRGWIFQIANYSIQVKEKEEKQAIEEKKKKLMSPESL